jgi:hypothetical protein
MNATLLDLKRGAAHLCIYGIKYIVLPFGKYFLQFQRSPARRKNPISKLNLQKLHFPDLNFQMKDLL